MSPRAFDVSLALGLLFALGSSGSGCSDVVAARPQLLVVVDTNAPLTGQLDEGDGPPQLAVDTLRVDLIARDGSVSDFLDVVAPETEDWPLSFGVVPEDAAGDPLLLRLRLFSGATATKGVNEGLTTIEPEASLTIDRLVAAQFPSQGVRRVGVLMDADCLGRSSRFSEPLETCVSANDADVLPQNAFDDVEEESPRTLAGTWHAIEPKPCEGTGPGSASCVPGGAAALGERGLASPLKDNFAPAYPYIPVIMSPFWMDRTEFTVGRFRELVSNGEYTGTPPLVQDPDHTLYELCSWLGPDDAMNDELPLNCVTPLAAEEVCNAVSGTLPSEAQWEYAARGRGAGWIFPWGNTFPDCCSASVARLGGAMDSLAACAGWWLEPAGSHTDAEACEGAVDVSRDGILDLAGSLGEATLDAWLSFDDPECWGQGGIRTDPKCPASEGSVVRRGGDWSSGISASRSTFRNQELATFVNITMGFRCVYEDGP